MNSRERLRRCYFNLETDRPAVYCRTGFPGNDPSYDALKAYLRQHSDLKTPWSAREFESDHPVSSCAEPYSEDFERIWTVMRTPAGDLMSSVLHGLKGNPDYHETYFIKTAEDAEKYLLLPLRSIPTDLPSFLKAEVITGDRGIVDIGLGLNPAGSVVELMGSQTFAVLSVTSRDLLHALCQKQVDAILSLVKQLAMNNVGPFFSMLGEEYIVPPLHGPADFHDFNVKYDKPIIDLIHEAGGRIHIHCHGAIKKVLHSFIEMGADVLHPIEAPPMGDVTISEAKKAVSGRMCLEGNIQIASMYDRTPEEIREETGSIIRDAFADHRGLIVSPTASPFIYGKGNMCFEQYKVMIDTVVGWKGI